ncbi:alpha/beta fold hydrolase [Microbacterium karelineae]|uniref:alpha/beta fold hydrolase n=1 Tax=Microbacterium karelineae TaxID=2654283 RepID=UPI0012EADA63|nr:alpha/beta fold hydrolase [Microbacterium karelineae]
MMAARRIKLGPVRTRYFDEGSDDGPIIVLLHEGAYGGDAENTYHRMIEPLSGFRLVIPEMLGFGGTDKAVFFGENPYEPRLRHLASFLDALDLRDIHVVGSSFGGGMALRMSIREETAWRMRSVTSISGTGGPFRIPEAAADMATYTPSIEDARRIDAWILPSGVEDEEHSRARLESSMRPGHWESMMAPSLRNPAAPEDARSWDFPEALAAGTRPTMLVVGDHDRLLEPGWEAELARHIPDVRVEHLPSGHSPYVSHPRETAMLIDAFVTEVENR